MIKSQFIKVLKENPFLFLRLLLIVVLALVTALIPPLILKDIVDTITSETPVSFTRTLLYFASLAAAGLIEAGKEVRITQFGQMITRKIRESMCEKLNTLPASYYTTNETGRIVSLFILDVDTIQALFSDGILSMFINVFQIFSIFIMIFVLSKGLGIVMILIIPLLFLLTRYCQKGMQKAKLSNRSVIAKAANHIPETLKSIRTIQNTRRQSFMEKKYHRYLTASYNATEKSNFYDSIYSPIILLINAMVIAFVMYMSSLYGEWRAFFGMSTGTAVALIAYINKIFDPIENLGMEIQNIQEAMAGMHRSEAFLEEIEEPVRTEELTNEDFASHSDAVAFVHTDFAYDTNHPVLQNLSFTVKDGEDVILAGRTGCGKTTAFKLILGLYGPNGGNVLIYGKPADSLSAACRQKLFGYVEQSFHRIRGSVKDQITLGDNSLSTEQVRSAAQLVGLDDIILAFPHSYDEPCSSALFSQGQFQLLSIARAIVRNPRIMLLDEITANLDSDTEDMVLNALRKAGENRTVISISHRIYNDTARKILFESH